jgi:hypothetical protein
MPRIPLALAVMLLGLTALAGCGGGTTTRALKLSARVADRDNIRAP